jgi:TPR repeat protein
LLYSACQTVLTHQDQKSSKASFRDGTIADFRNLAIGNLMTYYMSHQDFLGRARLCMDYVMPSQDVFIKKMKPINCENDSLLLANDYLTGEDGIKIDYKKAFDILTLLSANVTKPEIKAAVYQRLGQLYSRGQGGIPQDFDLAIENFKESLKYDSSNGYVHYYLAMCYNELVNYRDAFPEMLAAAKLGVPSAQLIVGTYYSKGQGVLTDYVEAYAWISLAITNGLGGKGMQDNAEMMKTSLMTFIISIDPSEKLLYQAERLEKKYYENFSSSKKTG